jgi:hypothetical protein
VTFSFITVVQLDGKVDAQTLTLELNLTESFDDDPSATSDCSVTPSIEGALLFIPFTERPYELSPEIPVIKLSSAPNAWTEVRLELGDE